VIKPEDYIRTPYDDHVMHTVTSEMVKEAHTEEEYDNFSKFMNGQTQCGAGIYAWDYERWIHEGMRNQQGSNWD